MGLFTSKPKPADKRFKAITKKHNESMAIFNNVKKGLDVADKQTLKERSVCTSRIAQLEAEIAAEKQAVEFLDAEHEQLQKDKSAIDTLLKG